MKKTTSWLIVFLFIGLAAWSVVVIRQEYFNDEPDVYLAFLKSIEEKGSFPDAAFLSSPGICQSGTDPFPAVTVDLFEAFVLANTQAEPIALREFFGVYNVVSFEDAKQIHGNNSLHFRPTNKRIIKLSRVGFDSRGTHALFCVEGPGSGFFVHLVREAERWIVLATGSIWIS